MEQKKTLLFEPEAEELIKNILQAWPSMTRKSWEERVRELCNLVALSKHEEKVTKDVVMESLNSWPLASHRWRIFGTLAEKGMINPDYKISMATGGTDLPKTHNWSVSKTGEQLKKKIEETKVLGIMASPREKGNTDILLSEILKGAKDKGADVEKVNIARMDIKFCTGCDACRQEKKLPNYCVIKDDLTNGLYKKFIDADIYVIGFPIYTGRENAALANFFDRFYGVEMGGLPWQFKDEEKKRAALVVTWGAPSLFFERTIENHCDLLSWYGVDVKEAIYARGCQKKGEVAKDKEGLEMAYKAGQRLVS